jgi:hypothetical protein
MAHGHNPAKVPKFKYKARLYSIDRKLMINNHFERFQRPGNLLKPKKYAPCFRGNTQFPIYFLLKSYYLVI